MENDNVDKDSEESWTTTRYIVSTKNQSSNICKRKRGILKKLIEDQIRRFNFGNCVQLENRTNVKTICSLDLTSYFIRALCKVIETTPMEAGDMANVSELCKRLMRHKVGLEEKLERRQTRMHLANKAIDDLILKIEHSVEGHIRNSDSQLESILKCLSRLRGMLEETSILSQKVGSSQKEVTLFAEINLLSKFVDEHMDIDYDRKERTLLKCHQESVMSFNPIDKETRDLDYEDIRSVTKTENEMDTDLLKNYDSQGFGFYPDTCVHLDQSQIKEEFGVNSPSASVGKWQEDGRIDHLPSRIPISSIHPNFDSCATECRSNDSKIKSEGQTHVSRMISVELLPALDEGLNEHIQAKTAIDANNRILQTQSPSPQSHNVSEYLDTDDSFNDLVAALDEDIEMSPMLINSFKQNIESNTEQWNPASNKFFVNDTSDTNDGFMIYENSPMSTEFAPEQKHKIIYIAPQTEYETEGCIRGMTENKLQNHISKQHSTERLDNGILQQTNRLDSTVDLSAISEHESESSFNSKWSDSPEVMEEIIVPLTSKRIASRYRQNANHSIDPLSKKNELFTKCNTDNEVDRADENDAQRSDTFTVLFPNEEDVNVRNTPVSDTKAQTQKCETRGMAVPCGHRTETICYVLLGILIIILTALYLTIHGCKEFDCLLPELFLDINKILFSATSGYFLEMSRLNPHIF